MKRFVLFSIMATSLIAVSCKTSKVVVPSEETQRLQEQIASKDNEIKSLQQQLNVAKNQLAVYEFFNNEEISIFTDNALEQNGYAKKLTGKNKITYETVRMITDVEHKLTDIDDKMSFLQKQQQAKKWSNSELKNAIRLEIKADMNDIGERLKTIEKRDLSVLSESQLGYYRKQLERFDTILNRYL